METTQCYACSHGLNLPLTAPGMNDTLEQLRKQLKDTVVPVFTTDHALQQRIITGHLDATDAYPTRVTVYISSAGRDTVLERKWIAATVRPALQQWCRDRLGLAFELIDM